MVLRVIQTLFFMDLKTLDVKAAILIRHLAKHYEMPFLS